MNENIGRLQELPQQLELSSAQLLAQSEVIKLMQGDPFVRVISLRGMPGVGKHTLIKAGFPNINKEIVFLDPSELLDEGKIDTLSDEAIVIIPTTPREQLSYNALSRFGFFTDGEVIVGGMTRQEEITALTAKNKSSILPLTQITKWSIGIMGLGEQIADSATNDQEAIRITAQYLMNTLGINTLSDIRNLQQSDAYGLKLPVPIEVIRAITSQLRAESQVAEEPDQSRKVIYQDIDGVHLVTSPNPYADDVDNPLFAHPQQDIGIVISGEGFATIAVFDGITGSWAKLQQVKEQVYSGNSPRNPGQEAAQRAVDSLNISIRSIDWQSIPSTAIRTQLLQSLIKANEYVKKGLDEDLISRAEKLAHQRSLVFETTVTLMHYIPGKGLAVLTLGDSPAVINNTRYGLPTNPLTGGVPGCLGTSIHIENGVRQYGDQLDLPEQLDNLLDYDLQREGIVYRFIPEEELRDTDRLQISTDGFNQLLYTPLHVAIDELESRETQTSDDVTVVETTVKNLKDLVGQNVLAQS